MELNHMLWRNSMKLLPQCRTFCEFYWVLTFMLVCIHRMMNRYWWLYGLKRRRRVAMCVRAGYCWCVRKNYVVSVCK